MKKQFLSTLLIMSAFISAGTATVIAIAAPAHWFAALGKKVNAPVNSWITVKVTGADGFDAKDEYIAEFAVKQWAESGNYKLALSEINFYGPSHTTGLDMDNMWEYHDGSVWAPISGAKTLELIPLVTLKSHTAYLKIRIKPGFFHTAGFAEYLSYNLELAAELLPAQ